MNKQVVSMTLSPNVVKFLDENRGIMSRSLFTESLILLEIEEFKHMGV